MKKIFITLTAIFLCISVCACGRQPKPETQHDGIGLLSQSESESEPSHTEITDKTEEHTVMKMNVQIGDKIFAATLEDNAAVREFTQMMQKAPVSIAMSDYSGFEKVGALGRDLTADDRPTTTVAGDIVLYNGNQIVMFYGSNSWSYTKIGHIDDLTGWEDALGSGSITAIFTIAE